MKINAVELYVRKSDDGEYVYYIINKNSEEFVWIYWPLNKRWSHSFFNVYQISLNQWKRLR